MSTPQARPAASDERRQSGRHPCVAHPLIKVLVRPSFQPLPAIARDASRRGISLYVPAAIPLGSRLALQFRGRRRGVSCIVSARVIHIGRHGEGWVAGCELTRPLSDEELAAFR
jgi:hypothetical protein